MQTDAQLTSGPFPPRKTTLERHEIACFHASGFPAQLALARWRHGGDLPHLHPGVPALRAAHFDSARRDFQAWLEGGGIHAADVQTADDAPAPQAARTLHQDGTRQVGTCDR